MFRIPRITSLLLALTAAMLTARESFADQRVVLKSGIPLQGLLLDVATLNQDPFAAGGQGQVKARPILMVDDGLRRVYLHRRGMVAAGPQDVRGVEQSIEFKQGVPLGGTPVQSIGVILNVTKFNRYGRRVMTVIGPKGSPIDITQGITEINARYAKVEALKGKPPYLWDMRVATSSIPAHILQSIFRQRIDQSDPDQRLMVVRFFIEAERYRAAEEELTRAIRDFPELAEMQAQLITIVGYQAETLLEEAELRSRVGQTQFARNVYSRFPLAAVGATMREKVRTEVEKLDEVDAQVNELVDALRNDLAKLKQGDQATLQRIFKEIEQGLSSSTLSRLSDYARLRDSETVSLDERVALAVSGWLMGSGVGEQNLVVATALVQVRDLVAEYLGPANLVRRDEILNELKAIEGSQIQYVAKLLPQLTPVLPFPDGSADQEIPGMFRLGRLAGQDTPRQLAEHPDYLIQLPPEYDPLREYPCLVVLHSAGVPPEAELAWWAGDFNKSKNSRTGYAARNGYIVVAPQWSRFKQPRYEYTAREHHAVLSSLRHAMRRSSIDADRVFIAGHGDGATAAWDIALAHPDHWAGMISINGEPAKTIRHYHPNARHLPMYFVMGWSSGPKPPLVRMGAILDKYMDPNNDATVVMYKGRGAEEFYEEIPNLFEWLNVSTHVRRPMPKEIETATMRAGDRYFWWLEMGPLKKAVQFNPILWDQYESRREGKVDAAILAGNQIRVTCPADWFTVWLRPDLGLDLNEQILVNRSKEAVRFQFDGELKTILEDTRTRADRKRPFWATIRVPK